jgi:hypothetical protein
MGTPLYEILDEEVEQFNTFPTAFFRQS